MLSVNKKCYLGVSLSVSPHSVLFSCVHGAPQVWTMRQNYPNLKIFVRASDVEQGFQLEKAGANAVVMESVVALAGTIQVRRSLQNQVFFGRGMCNLGCTKSRPLFCPVPANELIWLPGSSKRELTRSLCALCRSPRRSSRRCSSGPRSSGLVAKCRRRRPAETAGTPYSATRVARLFGIY